WMLAATLLDGELNPAQYAPERVVADDVQTLMTKVRIAPDDGFSDRFPEEMPAEVEITLTDGTTFRATHNDYEGFHTHPAGWDVVEEKFTRLTEPFADAALREELTHLVRTLEEQPTSALTDALARVATTRAG